MTNENSHFDQISRLKTLLSYLNHDGKSLAKALSFSQSFISQLINGVQPITKNFLNRITATYPKVNTHWLLTGEGEMIIEKKEPDLDQVNEDHPEYNRTPKGEGDPIEAFLALLKDQERRIKDHEQRLKALEETR